MRDAEPFGTASVVIVPTAMTRRTRSAGASAAASTRATNEKTARGQASERHRCLEAEIDDAQPEDPGGERRTIPRPRTTGHCACVHRCPANDPRSRSRRSRAPLPRRARRRATRHPTDPSSARTRSPSPRRPTPLPRIRRARPGSLGGPEESLRPGVRRPWLPPLSGLIFAPPDARSRTPARLPGVCLGSGAARAREDLVELREDVVAQPDLERAHRRVQLVGRSRSDDRRRDARLRQQPCERDVGRAFAEVGTDRLPALELTALLQDLALQVLAGRGVPPRTLDSAPASSPPDNGLYGMNPIPYSRTAGSTSSSTVRALRLYRLCSDARPRKFRARAISFARAMCHPAKLLDPT